MSKYIQGKDGKMAGSIPEGKTHVPTAAPSGATSTLVLEQPAADIDSLYERYLDHQRLADPDETIEGKPYDEVAYGLARTLPTDLDDEQVEDVYRLLHNAVGRRSDEDCPAPTDEQWQEWLDRSRQRLTDPDLDISDEDRARLLAQLDAAESGPKPDGREFYALNKVEGKMWAARFSLEEGYKQISAWYDTSPVSVKWQVEAFRREYQALAAAGQAPEIDPDYARGFKMSSGSSPKDPATVWSHMKAEDPELYEPSVVATRYVAFDTETTGKDSRDSNVIQIAMVEFDGDGTETRRFVTYIRPPEREDGSLWTGDEGAVGVHGILPEHVADAPSFAEVAPTIREWFDGATVVGQNVISFDQRHLAEEMVRAADGDKSAGRNLWPRAADTLWYAQRHLRGLPNNKLSTLAEHFQIGEFRAHDAGDDAAATAAVFFAMRAPLKARQDAAAEARRQSDPWAS